jgi:hypothetical protein
MGVKVPARSPLKEASRPFEEAIATLSTLFIPDIEEGDWSWWPDGHDFYGEWDQGRLGQLVLDSALTSSVNSLAPETLEEAIAIGEKGLSILARCGAEQAYLPFRLLLAPLEGEILRNLEDAASVLVSCFELGDLLSQDRAQRRADRIGQELYTASSDWAIPLVFGLMALKLRLLGPAFGTAMRAWSGDLLGRARAHYLPSER